VPSSLSLCGVFPAQSPRKPTFSNSVFQNQKGPAKFLVPPPRAYLTAKAASDYPAGAPCTADDFNGAVTGRILSSVSFFLSPIFKTPNLPPLLSLFSLLSVPLIAPFLTSRSQVTVFLLPNALCLSTSPFLGGRLRNPPFLSTCKKQFLRVFPFFCPR